MCDNKDALDLFKSYLYSLYDVSQYIHEIVCDEGLLMQDFDFYSEVLICACVEEQYIMGSIGLFLNTLYDIKMNWFNKLTHNTFRVEYDKYNSYYRIKLPLGISKSNLGFIKLMNTVREFKTETHDFTQYIGIEGMDKFDKTFIIECRHTDFCTTDFLKDNNVLVKFI